MVEPFCFIAYAPRGAGLLCALFYMIEDRDVCGWWLGLEGSEFESAFFMLENYFSAHDGAFYVTRDSDVYDGWVFDYARRNPKLPRPVPVDDSICHELERLQFGFACEWLCFPEDAQAAAERAAYAADELAAQDINLRHKKLNKLDKSGPVWLYGSPHLDMNIIERLARDWPLDYRAA